MSNEGQNTTGDTTYTYQQYLEKFGRPQTKPRHRDVEPEDPGKIGREMAKEIIESLTAKR